MEYAVVEIGGKQYRVKPGDVLEVDRIKSSGDLVSLDKILLHVNDLDVAIGKPYLTNAKVTAKILGDEKGKKIRVSRFTAKSRHRRVIGFRASLTRIQIEKITSEKSKTKKLNQN